MNFEKRKSAQAFIERHYYPISILHLSDADWVRKDGDYWQRKGSALDINRKKYFGCTDLNPLAPYDLFIPGQILNTPFVEIKSSAAMDYFTLTHGEFEHAENALAEGNDTLLKLFKLMPFKDEVVFRAANLFSDIRHNFTKGEPGWYTPDGGITWRKEPTRYVMIADFLTYEFALK